MAKVLKLNSKNGIVELAPEDLIDHDLLKWVKSSSIGLRQRKITDDAPFERVAAKLFVKKYPEDLVKLASKVIARDNDHVDVYLKIADAVANDLYNKHPDTVVFTKKEKD